MSTVTDATTDLPYLKLLLSVLIPEGFVETPPDLRHIVEAVDTSTRLPLVHSEVGPFRPLKIISCKTVDWSRLEPVPSLGPVIPEINGLLLANRSPEIVHLVRTNYQPTPVEWDVKDGERLPALRELVLQRCEWPFTKKTATNFWDFSKITHLELKEASMPFLETVPPECLQLLQSFETDSHCESQELVQIRASELVHCLPVHIVNLKEL